MSNKYITSWQVSNMVNWWKNFGHGQILDIFWIYKRSTYVQTLTRSIVSLLSFMNANGHLGVLTVVWHSVIRGGVPKCFVLYRVAYLVADCLLTKNYEILVSPLGSKENTSQHDVSQHCWQNPTKVHNHMAPLYRSTARVHRHQHWLRQVPLSALSPH